MSDELDLTWDDERIERELHELVSVEHSHIRWIAIGDAMELATRIRDDMQMQLNEAGHELTDMEGELATVIGTMIEAVTVHEDLDDEEGYRGRYRELTGHEYGEDDEDE